MRAMCSITRVIRRLFRERIHDEPRWRASHPWDAYCGFGALGLKVALRDLPHGVGHGMDGRMKAVMPGKIDESGIIGDTTAGITAVAATMTR
jgi:hypothetical protein